MDKVTFAVTTWNESCRGNFEWVRECVASAMAAEIVSEVVVVNDATEDFSGLAWALGSFTAKPLYLWQNKKTLAVFGNKVTSVFRATAPWVVMADSDNVYPPSYFDAIAAQWPWDRNVMYSPSVGIPCLDYRHMLGDWTLATAEKILQQKQGWCLVNTGNAFVHRQTFLDVVRVLPVERFDLALPDYLGIGDRSDVKWRHGYDSQDSFCISSLWWKAGKTLRVTPGMEYRHRVDKGTPGNYDRGPAEKEVIAPALLLELADAARGEKHEYRFLQRRAGRYMEFMREDGTILTVDWNTGLVTDQPSKM